MTKENKEGLSNYDKIFCAIDVLTSDGGIPEKDCQYIDKLAKELQDKVDKYENLDFTEDELQSHYFKLMKKVAIPNGFFKEHVEEFIGKSITQDKYLRIIEELNNSQFCSDISELFSEWLNDYAQEVKND